MNFVCGENAHGKTSLLEAIHLLATFQSFRTNQLHGLIKNQETTAQLKSQIQSDDRGDLETRWSSDLSLVFTLGDELKTKRAAFIDGKKILSAHSFLKKRLIPERGFHSIAFSPSDHQLIKGEPSLRRGYLDRILSAESTEYYEALSKYKKVLAQRNSLLKLAKQQKPYSPEMEEAYRDQMIQHAAEVVRQRINWLNEIQPDLQRALSQIAPTQSQLTLRYQSKYLAEMNNLALTDIQSSLASRIEELHQAELALGTTLAGPQRDDWALIGDHDENLDTFGSQGEVRSAILALKLAEIIHFEKTSHIRPILLVDDFSSELDEKRRKDLLQRLVDTHLQVFLSTTDARDMGYRQYFVSDGAIQSVARLT